jgi:hypothetical protein
MQDGGTDHDDAQNSFDSILSNSKMKLKYYFFFLQI